MTREDFISTIGYDGDSALVDRKARRKYSGMTTIELVEAGFFKPALCSAIYSENPDELNAVLEKYNSLTEKKIDTAEQLKLVLGIQRMPEEITKTVVI
ncbi:MAG: hypothetical protein FWC36_08055 [Spirochaetes bacterium]|nr:hypothetical protein [Spirochaetota bacterium]